MIQYETPGLKEVLAKSFDDAIHQRPGYFDNVFHFVQNSIKKGMMKGKSLYDSEQVIVRDFEKAQKEYPPGKIQNIQCSIKDKCLETPDLAADLKKKGTQNKQTLVDRIHQLCFRGKQNHTKFKAQLQPLLVIDKDSHFKSGYKMQRTKAYLRCITKILEPHIDGKIGSRQVYTELISHHYWGPVYSFFNKVFDAHAKDIKIQLYDLLRCKCYYKNVQDIQKVLARLEKKYNVFRVKNRINQGTRDILLNLKFEDSIAEVQLALKCDTSKYDFYHKLYQMLREKIGPAFCCFALGVDEIVKDNSENIQPTYKTKIGLIKKAVLREKVPQGWQRISMQQAKHIKDELGKCYLDSDPWTILSMKTGTMKGKGYTSNYFEAKQYGPQAGQMVLVQRNK